MKMHRLALAGALLFISAPIHAQTEDGCVDVLRYSARDYSLETAYEAVALSAYEQSCSNNQVRSSNNFSSSIEAVIEKVPAKFSLGSGSTKDKASFFCKTFDEDFKRREDYYRGISKVSSESTKAWLECKSFAQGGVQFRPKVSATQIVVDVRRTNSDPVKVELINFDSKLLNCIVPNSDNRTGTATVDANTRKTLTNEYWPITCNRIPEKTSDPGAARYPRAVISVSTTKGSLMLPVAEANMGSAQWAEDVQRQLDSLGVEIAKLKSVDIYRTADSPIVAEYCSLSSLSSAIAANFNGVTGANCTIEQDVNGGSWTLKIGQRNNHMGNECAMACFGVKK